MRSVIRNVRLIQGGAITPCDIALRDDRVEQIVPPGRGEAGLANFEGDGLYLSHGFIDIHLHGGGGADFMDGTVDAWRRVVALHLRHGTTCMTPTTLSASREELLCAFSIFDCCKAGLVEGVRLLGLHLEGPYFSPAQAGAQDPSQLRAPKPEEYMELLERCPDILRWSLAPELPGALEMGRELARRGIVAAIGHSDATYEQVCLATEAGFSHVTHLYSATSSVTRLNGYRRGGVVEAAYLLPQLSSELIADGRHLPPELLQMAFRFIGPGRLALVTDAMRAAGQTSGESMLGSLNSGTRVIVEDGVAKMPDRKAFAGSVCTADRLVRNMVTLAGAPLTAAIEMMTVTPARIMRKSAVTGTVAPGRKADLVLFDENIDVKCVWTDGIVRWRAQ